MGEMHKMKSKKYNRIALGSQYIGIIILYHH
jgi:hypothetical protein